MGDSLRWHVREIAHFCSLFTCLICSHPTKLNHEIISLIEPSVIKHIGDRSFRPKTQMFGVFSSLQIQSDADLFVMLAKSYMIDGNDASSSCTKNAEVRFFKFPCFWFLIMQIRRPLPLGSHILRKYGCWCLHYSKLQPRPNRRRWQKAHQLLYKIHRQNVFHALLRSVTSLLLLLYDTNIRSNSKSERTPTEDFISELISCH